MVHLNVINALGNLPLAHQRRLKEIVDTLKSNPLPFKEFDIKKLKGYRNLYRARQFSACLWDR